MDRGKPLPSMVTSVPTRPEAGETLRRQGPGVLVSLGVALGDGVSATSDVGSGVRDPDVAVGDVVSNAMMVSVRVGVTVPDP